jgi:hypothetical protein
MLSLLRVFPSASRLAFRLRGIALDQIGFLDPFSGIGDRDLL